MFGYRSSYAKLSGVISRTNSYNSSFKRDAGVIAVLMCNKSFVVQVCLIKMARYKSLHSLA